MQNEHPHARGIKIQKRVVVSAFFILLEAVALILLQRQITHRFIWAYTVFEVLSFIVAITIINKKGNPDYKIMWIVFILLVPVFGLTVYIICGGGRVLPHVKKKMAGITGKYMPLLLQNPNAENGLAYADMLHARQADFLMNESGFPLYDGTSVEYLSPGEKFFEQLIYELKKAEKYIYIEFFILAEGYMWDEIHSVLLDKIENGVEVKIIFDDFGSINRQYKNFTEKLRKEGFEVAAFNKIAPSFNVFMNNRNHRKIIVIDGQTAFTGGINIADEYINKIERFGYWLDSAVMIKGSAVDSFLIMFAIMWEFTSGKKIDYLAHRCSVPVEDAKGYVLPYCDDPVNGRSPAEGIYLQIINTSCKYVYIATPYLIIDNNMNYALCAAAKSGIDVRIVTPGIPDKNYVHPVTQYYYGDLLKAGVKIYEYTPGFIHSKMFVSDDSVATVGTVNMDYRSFVFHFECGTWFSSNDAVLDVKDDFGEIFAVSHEITEKEWSRRSTKTRFKQWILHIFSPFM